MPARHLAKRPPPDASAPRPPSVEILDIAFHGAQKVSPHGKTKSERDRLRARLKIVRASATVIRHLRLAVRPLRAESVGPFERTLVDGAFRAGTLDRALLRLRRAEERIRKLTREAESGLRRAPGPEELGEAVRRFYGRLSSFVREVDPDLEQLRAIARFLHDRPQLDLTAPRLVVAGFPNVGKSSLVARLSSANPKVADYPFTTVSLAVGHADLGFDRLQVVDTPGVLNRPSHENPSEVEAEAAVSQAATAVLFVLDPSGACGYTIEEQEQLLERWREEFPKLPIVPVETKSDLVRRPTGRLQVSCVTGEGIDELLRQLKEKLARPVSALAPRPEVAVEDIGDPVDEPPPRPAGRVARKRSRPAK